MATAARPRGRPFAAGVSGNAKGRPRGARNKINDTLVRLLSKDAESILTAILTTAKNGDLQAGVWALSRILAPAKDRAVQIDLPPCNSLVGIEAAHEAIIRAVSVGIVTPAEAASLANMVEGRRRTLEVGEMERRLTEVEAKHLKGKP